MSQFNRQKLVKFRKSYAIIIGINRYPKINGSLTTPVADAEGLARVLIEKQGFAREDVRLLTDPNGAEIKALLDELKSSAKANGNEEENGGFDISKRDCLLFYYAGHGMAGDIDGDGPAGYLMPSDASFEIGRLSENDTLIPMEMVFDTLDALNCHHTLLVLDCCFAGTFRRVSKTRAGIGGLGLRPMTKTRFERYKKDCAWQVLASAGPAEKAADLISERSETDSGQEGVNAGEHSPFAKALIDALSGSSEIDVKPRGKNLGDGVITAHELFIYLHEEVERLTRKDSGFKPQNPDLFPMSRHAGGQFIFCDPRHPKNDPDFDERKKENPYKGLHLYQPWDRDWFFGRSGDIAALLKKLGESPNGVMLISGASGTGKSSLVRAGLLPFYLEQGYQCFVLRPGSRPWSLEPLSLEAPAKNGSEIASPLPLTSELNGFFESGKRILFIDQYEEFFSECNKDEQAALEAMLIELLEKARTVPDAKIIISIRSDFEWELELSDLGKIIMDRDLLNYQFYRLAGLDLAQQREALTGPAMMYAYEFEKRGQESLADQILQDIEYAPSALALLSFTMSELFRISEVERADSGEDNRIFTFSIYEDEDKLGGVAGALRGKLNQVYNALPDEAHRQTMREVMVRMVRLNDGAYSRRRLQKVDGLNELQFNNPAKNKRVEAIIEALSEAQLIVHGGKGDSEYLELIHDSLVNTLPTLEWIKTFGRDNLILQRQLWAAVSDSRSPANAGPPAMSYGVTAEDGIPVDDSLTNDFSELWENNPRLLQIIDLVVVAAKNYLMEARETIIKKALPDISPADRDKFLHFWQDCEKKEAVPNLNSLILSGYSEKLLNMFLKKGDHWLNRAEIDFILASWNERIKDIMDLKEQRDEAVRLRLEANFNLAKIYEATAGEVLTDIRQGDDSQHNYQKAWLFNLAALNQEIADDAQLPIALGRLSNPGWHRGVNPKVQQMDGHSAEVYCVAFSYDGKMLASASADNTIRLWDVAKGKEIGIFKGHNGAVNSVIFSLDSQTLASASTDKTVRLWDVKKARALQIFKGHSAAVYCVAFLPDGKVLASGSADKTIRLWDAAGGQQVTTLNGHNGEVKCVAVSPDGKILASGSTDKSIRLWDMPSGQELRRMQGHNQTILSVAFSPDGSALASASQVSSGPDAGTLAVGSEDTTVHLWDVARGKVLRTFSGHSEKVQSVVFSPNGRQLASAGADNTVRLWDVVSSKLLATFSGYSSDFYSVAFSPDGKTLASSSQDSMIRLWDVDGHQVLNALRGHKDIVFSITFSPDGKTLASASKDTTIRLWDVKSGAILSTFSGHESPVDAIAISPDGKILASGPGTNTVRLWDLKNNKVLATLSGHSRAVRSVAFSPDGKKLASGAADKTVRIWDIESGKTLVALEGHRDRVYSVAFSPDGKTVASAAKDATIRLWDVASGKELQLFNGHKSRVYSIAFSPDGKTLASGSWDKTVRLWDLATGKQKSVFSDHTGFVWSVVFSPDGRRLASASADKTVRLWDIASGNELALFRGHDSDVYQAVFSPDGNMLASCSDDHTIRLWDLKIINEFLEQRRDSPNFQKIYRTSFALFPFALKGSYLVEDPRKEQPGKPSGVGLVEWLLSIDD